MTADRATARSPGTLNFFASLLRFYELPGECQLHALGSVLREGPRDRRGNVQEAKSLPGAGYRDTHGAGGGGQARSPLRAGRTVALARSGSSTYSTSIATRLSSRA